MCKKNTVMMPGVSNLDKYVPCTVRRTTYTMLCRDELGDFTEVVQQTDSASKLAIAQYLAKHLDVEYVIEVDYDIEITMEQYLETQRRQEVEDS